MTTNINELIINNKELKDEIEDLRKRKMDTIKKRDEIIAENERKNEILKNMNQNNEVSRSKIMYKEYKNTVTEGNLIQKDFEEERDELEEEYKRIREEYIKRERETKRENAKKRNMAALALSSKSNPKNSKSKDMEMELKKIADEQIMDRIPILDICIEKWREINNFKKTCIQTFHQNAIKIREAFNKLTTFLGIDSFEELPIVYQKTEQQMSNINMYKEKLETQNDQLESEKNLLIEQIKLLYGTRNLNTEEKSKIYEKKLKNIKVIEKTTKDFEKEIELRMELIQDLKPEIFEYLEKLGDTYLSDFIKGKINIDDSNEYSEITVDKYFANVQDYFKLIFEWNRTIKEVRDSEREINKLRDDMKQKLGKFEQNRLITSDVFQSIQLDYKKGINLEDIIKKNSQNIILDIQTPVTRSTVINKTLKKKFNLSNDTTDTRNNNRYGNDSQITNKQQSSIIVPNNSKSLKDKSAEMA